MPQLKKRQAINAPTNISTMGADKRAKLDIENVSVLSAHSGLVDPSPAQVLSAQVLSEVPSTTREIQASANEHNLPTFVAPEVFGGAWGVSVHDHVGVAGLISREVCFIQTKLLLLRYCPHVHHDDHHP